MPQPSNPTDALLHERDTRGVVTLTLNRPQAFNALSEALLDALQAQIDSLMEDDTARVVILRGAGRAFCAGHDLKEMRAQPSQAYYQSLFARCGKVMTGLMRLPQPVIAQVHGIATAAGCQLVASCDMAVAAEGRRFGVNGVNIGLFCSTPMVALSRNLSAKHAMEMLLLGEMVPAQDAARMGLVNRVVPAGEALAGAQALAAIIASKSAATVKTGKRTFYEQREMGLKAAYDHASAVMVENMLARDAEEGIGAFIEKRPPVWER